MEITPQTIVGELVAHDYRTASVFKKQHIDFCCNGKRSIADACIQKQIDPLLIIENLKAVMIQANALAIDYSDWPLDLLADYIEKKHHRYVTAKIIEIAPFLNKVAKVHGGNHPELLEVLELFAGCAEELTSHMQKEEQLLFPYIRNMVSGKTMESPFGSIQNPIQVMMGEHTQEGERFMKIATLTQNYTPPEDACNTYKVTFALLKEFEEDLHLHIHLENNILFPKAIALEAKIKNAHATAIQ